MSDNYTIRYLAEDEYENWDRFVEQHPEGTLFHTTSFLHSMSEPIGRRLMVAGIFQQSNLIGGFAFTVVKKLGIKLIAVPYDCPVYHPLFTNRDTKYISKQESYNKKLVNILLLFLKNSYCGFELKFSFFKTDFRPYKQTGLEIDLSYTYLLDLSNFNEKNVPFDPAVKRQIKKAAKNNYTLSMGLEKENVNSFYSLLSQTYKRQGLALKLSEENYESLFKQLYAKGWFELYVLKFNDIPASAMGIVNFNGVAYYWLSASNPEVYNLGGTSALIAEVLSNLKRKEVKHFDFVGANTESIARFKAGFNFELTPVYNIKYESRVVKQLFKIKKLLKR